LKAEYTKKTKMRMKTIKPLFDDDGKTCSINLFPRPFYDSFFLMFENILRSKILTLVTFLPMTTQKGMLFIYYNVCYSGWLNLRRRCSI